MSRVQGLPAVTIELGGAPLPLAELRDLSAVRVQQRLSLPTLCELTFVDPRGGVITQGVAPGTALRVSTTAQAEPLFSGEVTAVEYAHMAGGARAVRVRGYDVLHRLRKRQPVRAHVQVTLRDVAREVVSDLGLSVEASAPGPLWRHLVQHGQSDLDFLVELADRCGVYLVLRDGALRLVTLEGEGEPLPLLLGESLQEATVEVNGDPACRSVSAGGWDPLRARHHSARASHARQGRKVEVEAPPSLLGSPGERALVNELAEADAHAEAVAQAELDHRSAREVVLTALAEGDARLRPGTRVEVRGITPAISGRYVLTAVNHLLDTQRGFVSELSSAPPPRRARERASAATLGVVSRVDDPDGLGRVRATLPAYNDVETEWMQVLCLGAGSGKGLVMLPDVGDQVLLVLADGDPARGMVMGGFFGESAPSDTGVEGGSVRRYTARTPGGHLLRLDDAGKSLRVEDGAGSYLELTPSKVRLHATAPLDIEAPGQPVVIRGQSIDFRRG
ncbi:phage baseplate assembly protein V [Hyalangium rubrum]|uniref:Phage baseplate assembly protein V n=1 Tax=Hyalangium rubrum TaxID=3103134 RepID=A0ABU5H3B4_9BACT|nr:phage baseplate assembly protein V [Hyalangium sp. s54d21]MDY7227262.1 phage baseplate assembly protein V [Hyalangium sp. s54d21]